MMLLAQAVGLLAEAQEASASAAADHSALVVCVVVLGALLAVKLILIIFLVRHLFVRTIPDLIVTFDKTNAAERALCGEQFTLISAAIGGLTAALQRDRAELVSGINAHTTDQIGKYRHEMYDQIHAAILRRDVTEIRAERLRKEQQRAESGTVSDEDHA